MQSFSASSGVSLLDHASFLSLWTVSTFMNMTDQSNLNNEKCMAEHYRFTANTGSTNAAHHRWIYLTAASFRSVSICLCRTPHSQACTVAARNVRAKIIIYGLHDHLDNLFWSPARMRVHEGFNNPFGRKMAILTLIALVNSAARTCVNSRGPRTNRVHEAIK